MQTRPCKLAQIKGHVKKTLGWGWALSEKSAELRIQIQGIFIMSFEGFFFSSCWIGEISGNTPGIPR